ncbi:MAG TPA: right-handed parallel beta-helix repeat-containing protein [Terriglobales bacterium]|nr:right-handed parallel beta-helix repeat-containing protein [Terriglobales bacterium]
MPSSPRLALALLAAAACLALLPPPAAAVDGVTLISQATAATGLPGCNATGFPIVICKSGSYRLASNLSPSPGADAIHINADDVSLDLNNFTLLGARGANGISSSAASVSILNGTITGFSDGVYLVGNDARVRLVRTSGGANGIYINSGTISQCSASGASSTGLVVLGDGLVERSRATGNGTGIFIRSGLVTGNEVSFNSSNGVVVELGSANITNNAIENQSTGTGLDFAFGAGGYTDNSFFDNSTDVFGGTSLGHNLCSNYAAC